MCVVQDQFANDTNSDSLNSDILFASISITVSEIFNSECDCDAMVDMILNYL